jgi:tetratricopeptide (TPR) repeat protein
MEDSPPLQGNPAELIRAELETLSELIIRADVPVGVALSSGLDSSAIAALAARKYPGTIHAFSVGYPGRPPNDERTEAKALADYLKIPCHEVELDTREMVDFFPELVSCTDDPIADISGFGYYSVMKAAREHNVPVILQGQGADELFWGYPWVSQAVRASLQKAEQLKVLNKPAAMVFYDLTPDFQMACHSVTEVYTPAFNQALGGRSAFELFTFPLPWPPVDLRMTSLICQTYLLENGIAQGDRLSMASSVELRLPFVDYRLVETVIGLRKVQADYHLSPKAWLKEALWGILPDWVMMRPKRGFAPPVGEWYRGLFSNYSALLADGYLVQAGVLRREGVQALLKNPFPPGSVMPLSFKALLLELWCRGMAAQLGDIRSHRVAETMNLSPKDTTGLEAVGVGQPLMSVVRQPSPAKASSPAVLPSSPAKASSPAVLSFGDRVTVNSHPILPQKGEKTTLSSSPQRANIAELRNENMNTKEWQLKTPVCLIIFNRPDTTAKVFEAIRQAKPPKLLVVADGPRLDHPGEADICAATQAVLQQIDWNCEATLNLSATNLGCGQRVSSGLDWVFSTVEEAIILEDDCVPHPTFFRFCEELLEKYRTDERIMAISGNNFQFGSHRTPYSYYFSRYFHCWGWATWRRAWQHFDNQMQQWPMVQNTSWLHPWFGNNPQAIQYWSTIFENVYRGFNSWAYIYTFTCWHHQGLTILPHDNLVSNIGFDDQATHTKGSNRFASLPTKASSFPLSHPPAVNRDNSTADDFTERTVFSGGIPVEPAPTDIESLIQQSLTYLNTNRNQEALNLLDQVLRTKPDLVTLHYGKAVALARLSRIPEAVETLNQLLATVPIHEKGRQLLTELRATHPPLTTSPVSQPRPIPVTQLMAQAQQALNTNDLSGALNLLGQAKALKQPAQNLDTLRAMCFLKLNQAGAAWQALLEELRYFPDNTDAKNLLHQIETQVPQLTTGQINDAEFQELLNLVRLHTMLSEARLYSLFSLVKRICMENIPGNVVECGVAGGGSTALMAMVIKRYTKQPRWLYAFDSFEGLPPPTQPDKHQGMPAAATGWGTGTCAGSEEHLRNLCTSLGITDLVKPVKGYFQDTLPKMRNWVGMIALLHLDGDWYESTQVILHHLYDRVVNDGFLQVDDYGYWEGCRQAIQEFEISRQVRFEIHQIDETGVWFVKPDKFPLNPALEPKLVNDFFQDDPVTLGVQSQMSQNERFQLYYALRKLLPTPTLAPLRFIEIGSFAGASLWLTCQALKRVTSQFQGFAIEPGNHPQFAEVLQHVNQHVTHFPMLSAQALSVLQQRVAQDGNLPVFIFIDGDHTYEAVWQDALNYFQLLAPGGLMVFHDYLPPLTDENREAILFHHGGKEPGIRRAFEELVECTYGEVVEIPLLSPTDPTQTQAYLPIIPGVVSTLRAYRKTEPA